MLPDPIQVWGIPQRADYVAFNIKKHDREPTVCSTTGGNAPVFCNVLHTKPRPDIAAGTEGDDIYLLGECFQMDGAVTRAIEAIGDAGIMDDIIRLRKFSERKCEIQRERQQLGRLADFLTAKWCRHYAEEWQMHDQEKAMIGWLVAAWMIEQMEPYPHYHNDHAYLTRTHMHNDILQGGWSEIVMPRAYPMCHAFIWTYILLYTSSVLLMCTTRPPCHSYWTFSLSRYLVALDLLTCHGSPAYLGHTSHTHAAPLIHTYLYCFQHVWVISTAITPIFLAAHLVRYCTSVSPSPASWHVFSACYDLYFTWLLVTRSYLYR